MKKELGPKIFLTQFWDKNNLKSYLPRTIAQLASYTTHPVTAFNINIETLPLPESLHILPAAIGISITTYKEFVDLPNYVLQVRQLYGEEPIIAVGGIYPSLFPISTLGAANVDVVFCGYAELAWQKFTQELSSLSSSSATERKKRLFELFESYPGIYFKQKQYKSDEIPVACEPLLFSQVTQPNYGVLQPGVEVCFRNNKHTSAINMHYQQIGASVLIGRGCFRDCPYCVISTLKSIPNIANFPVETRKPRDVVDEIEFLVSVAQVDRLPIFLASPDGFTHPPQLFQIIKEIDRRGLTSQTTISLDASIGSILIALQKYPAGLAVLKNRLWKVIVGVESLSEPVQNYIGKQASIADVEKVLNFLADIGTIPFVQILPGLPPDSHQTLKESLSRLIWIRDRVPPFAINVHRAVPFPGTIFHNQVIKEGLITSKPTITDRTVGKALVNTRYLTSDEVTQWIRAFLEHFYSDDYLKRLATDPRPYIHDSVMREANKSGIYQF